MYNSFLAKEKILRWKREGKERIVVLPYGEYGRYFEKRMETFGMKPLYCIDNFSFDGTHVFRAGDCRYEDGSITYLIATEKEEVFASLRRDLIGRGVKEGQIESAQDGFEEIHGLMTSKNKVHLDFLCVGFAKCGTTSLDAALRRNPRIFLPAVKETFFISELSDAKHVWVRDLYASAGGYACAGGVEPSYMSYPDLVFRYFGSGLKLIVCIRDPIKWMFSMARFHTVFPNPGVPMESLYQTYGTFSPEFFDAFVREFSGYFSFHENIGYWLEYFPPDQIKFVFLEDMVEHPSAVMDDIQGFIGLDAPERMRYDSFPRENANNRVARDGRDYRVNAILSNAWFACCDSKLQEQFFALCEKVQTCTTCECDVAMWDSTRQYLTEFFREDIRKTEELIGRSLPYFKD